MTDATEHVPPGVLNEGDVGDDYGALFDSAQMIFRVMSSRLDLKNSC